MLRRLAFSKVLAFSAGLAVCAAALGCTGGNGEPEEGELLLAFLEAHRAPSGGYAAPLALAPGQQPSAVETGAGLLILGSRARYLEEHAAWAARQVGPDGCVQAGLQGTSDPASTVLLAAGLRAAGRPFDTAAAERCAAAMESAGDSSLVFAAAALLRSAGSSGFEAAKGRAAAEWASWPAERQALSAPQYVEIFRSCPDGAPELYRLTAGWMGDAIARQDAVATQLYAPAWSALRRCTANPGDDLVSQVRSTFASWTERPPSLLTALALAEAGVIRRDDVIRQAFARESEQGGFFLIVNDRADLDSTYHAVLIRLFLGDDAAVRSDERLKGYVRRVGEQAVAEPQMVSPEAAYQLAMLASLLFPDGSPEREDALRVAERAQEQAHHPFERALVLAALQRLRWLRPAEVAEASSIAPGIAEAACGSEFQAAALAYAWLVAADFGPSTLPACHVSPTPSSGHFLSNVYYAAIPGRSDAGPVDVSPFRAPNGGYANEPGASILSLNATCAALFLRQLEGRPAAVRHPLATTGLCFI